MRSCWIAAIAVLFTASPALADVTARFTAAGNEPPMVVQVSDNGDSRIVVTQAVYLAKGGTSYMVLNDAQGQFVARKEDFLSLLAELMQRQAFAGAPGQPGPVITETGTEVVAGRPGRVFRISSATNPADYIEIVVNSDPELEALGRVIANELQPIFTAAMAQADPRLAEAVSDLFHRGAVLRFGNEWRLESIETSPVPASQFALPSAPISRDALATRLHARSSR